MDFACIYGDQVMCHTYPLDYDDVRIDIVWFSG